jgi:hypothetical protein
MRCLPAITVKYLRIWMLLWLRWALLRYLLGRNKYSRGQSLVRIDSIVILCPALSSPSSLCPGFLRLVKCPPRGQYGPAATPLRDPGAKGI